MLTYQQLHREVCRFANVLKRNKLKKGDRVHHLHADDSGGGGRDAGLRAASARRIGGLRRVQRGVDHATASQDCGAVAIITADGGYRRGAIVPLKENVDDALQGGDAQR